MNGATKSINRAVANQKQPSFRACQYIQQPTLFTDCALFHQSYLSSFVGEAAEVCGKFLTYSMFEVLASREKLSTLVLTGRK